MFGFLVGCLLARPGDAGAVPAGALRPVRGQGPRRVLSRRRGSTRRPTSTSARIWADGWRSGPGASSAPEAQVDDSVIHRGGTVGAEARVVASVVGARRARGIRSDADGMRSGGRVSGPGRRGPGRRSRAGGHRGGPGVDAGSSGIRHGTVRASDRTPFPCDASVSSRSSSPYRRPSCPRPPPARAIPSRSTAAAGGTGSASPSGGRTGWRPTAGRRRRSSRTSTAAPRCRRAPVRQVTSASRWRRPRTRCI